jgi:signal-transduction protein with cAMP-binding, CBS, and nucleotidyltransferase domain
MLLASDTRLPNVPMNATIRDTARELKRTGEGAVLVRDQTTVAGIVTERDLVHRVLAEDVDTDREIYDFCTTELLACRETETVGDAARLMQNKGVRHLLVLDSEGGTVGLLPIETIVNHPAASGTVADILTLGKHQVDL